MPWCRSYGCREHVDDEGDYCPDCTHLLVSHGRFPSGGRYDA